jgi:hypothetical protein
MLVMLCIVSAQAELTAAGEKVERKAIRAAAASHIWLDWIAAKELPAEALLQTVLASKSGASKVTGALLCDAVLYRTHVLNFDL